MVGSSFVGSVGRINRNKPFALTRRRDRHEPLTQGVETERWQHIKAINENDNFTPPCQETAHRWLVPFHPGRVGFPFRMSSYTKLFHSILDSSIWQESHQTRIVWVTMLAMADQHGEVQAAIPGLAKRAGVTIEEAEKAIETLSSPDKYSRTPDHEGRRIAKIDGGWEILNHAKYRFEASLEDRKEKAAIRSKRFRDRNKEPEALQSVTERDGALRVTLHNADVTQSPDKQKQIQKQRQNEDTPKAPKGAEPEGFGDFWKVYPRKVAKPAAIKAWVRLNPNDETLRRIISAVRNQSTCPDWVKDGGQFIPHPATYLNQRRWEDMIEAIETKESLRQKLLAHRGNPNHANHINATAEDLAEYAPMLARYKAMT